MSKIVFIGDSLTFGYGVIKSSSFFYLLKENFKSYEFINCGICGDTTIDILNRFTEDTISNKANLVCVLCGTNDFLKNRTVDQVFYNISIMIKESVNANLKILLLSPPSTIKKLALEKWDNFCDYDFINNSLKELSYKLKCYSKENNISFIDLFSHFNSLNNIDTFYTDGIHLSKNGNIEVFNLITNYLSNLDII